MKPLKVNYGQH